MDSLQLAIELERQGEAFYRLQATLHQDHLSKVFTLLADDEAMHGAMIEKAILHKSNELLDQHTIAMCEKLFKQAADFSMSSKETMEQLDIYRLALAKEKDSMNLYEKLLEKNDNDSGLFTFLLQQEQEHYRIIEDLIILVNRPNEWVESAEFGKRDDY